MFWNNWSFSWLVRYIGAMDDPSYDGNNVFGYTGPPSYDKHDIRVAYDWERYRLSFGINNVTDEDPPYVFNNGANTGHVPLRRDGPVLVRQADLLTVREYARQAGPFGGPLFLWPTPSRRQRR